MRCHKSRDYRLAQEKQEPTADASVSDWSRARGRIRTHRLRQHVYPPRRQAHGKPTALRWCTVDQQFRLVTHEHVLDDGEPEAGAAGCARPAAVDAIEALREPRNVLGGDANARVDDAEFAAVGADPPCERNATAVGRVAHGIAHEIAERASELVAAADHV